MYAVAQGSDCEDYSKNLLYKVTQICFWVRFWMLNSYGSSWGMELVGKELNLLVLMKWTEYLELWIWPLAVIYMSLLAYQVLCSEVCFFEEEDGFIDSKRGVFSYLFKKPSLDWWEDCWHAAVQRIRGNGLSVILFRPDYSTEMALITLVNDLWWNHDVGSSSILVHLGISAAFDAVNRGILLEWIGGLEIKRTVL